MEIKKLQGAIEAILFSSGDAVPLDRIAEALELDRNTAAKLMKSVMDTFNQSAKGIQIIQLENQYQMCSVDEYGETIRRTLDLRRNAPLSQAAMEVLAVIAYQQPVTKAFVEQVRGVDSSGVISNLCEKGLVEERGRLDLPGRPLLYGTTSNFLRCMNLSSLRDLPPLPQNNEEETEEDLEAAENTMKA